MDQGPRENLSPPARAGSSGPRPSRRGAMKLGLCAAGTAAAAGAMGWHVYRSVRLEGAAEVFKDDAPAGELWRLWKRRGWAQPARHYQQLGRNIKCRLCPNACLLTPEDRGRCRNRVNKDGTLYTIAYGNPCSFHVDPIEKKPLFHFLPATGVFSIATAGCGFRCLNCQNWEISQAKPDETKDPHGPELRGTPQLLRRPLTGPDIRRLSLLPEDVVAVAEDFRCASIAYTYSEPTAFYEYMYDTAGLAGKKNIKNVWVTCGYINPEPLAELCGVMDAANVDLKSFSDKTYRKLNSGKLQPILDTLLALKQRGVWFEVTNLIVPTYTDKPDMIRRMCDWLLENLGPDYPLHFSRFHPQHKLDHLPATPAETLQAAKAIAVKAGLHYVYIGNMPGLKDAETTFCPSCHRAVIDRLGYHIRRFEMAGGKCRHCGTKIAGVWSV